MKSAKEDKKIPGSIELRTEEVKVIKLKDLTLRGEDCHLVLEESEYLNSRSFILVEHCIQGKWSSGSIFLTLEQTVALRDALNTILSPSANV